MDDDCTCFVTPEYMWFRYGSAIEPGSQMEPNPECPVHFPESERMYVGRQRSKRWVRSVGAS